MRTQVLIIGGGPSGLLLSQLLSDINIDCLDDLERKDIVQNLNKKMKSAAKQMKFEVAALYRDKINEIKQAAAK